jgi:hypothetical protein
LTRRSSILVVANQTALSVGLEAALRARLDSGPARFTLVLPLGRTPDATRLARHVGATLRVAGFDVDCLVGDRDPLHAVLEVWNPTEFDEVIVSTLPESASRWMKASLPRRIEERTGALVRHVEARELVPLPRLAGVAA